MKVLRSQWARAKAQPKAPKGMTLAQDPPFFTVAQQKGKDTACKGGKKGKNKGKDKGGHKGKGKGKGKDQKGKPNQIATIWDGFSISSFCFFASLERLKVFCFASIQIRPISDYVVLTVGRSARDLLRKKIAP